MDSSTWNLQGKSLGRLGDWASSVKLGVLGLLSRRLLSVGSLKQFHLPPESDLIDELILGASDTQSYLGQGIVLDKA